MRSELPFGVWQNMPFVHVDSCLQVDPLALITIIFQQGVEFIDPFFWAFDGIYRNRALAIPTDYLSIKNRVVRVLLIHQEREYVELIVP